MAYIGNSPGVASQRITTTFTATAGQTTFTPQSGYTVGYIDLFVNGVKLINGDDFTASNGTTVVLIAAASADDVVETVAFLPRGLSDGYTKAEADSRYMSASATTLPSQTNNAGKFLTTDGTNASWATVTMPDEIRDPVNSSPANGSGGQLETPTLTSSAFRSLYGETHSKSQWQVSTASDFSTTVVSTGDSNSLTSYTISSGVLSPATTYYWRVRYKDSNGTYSDWSTATTFITTSTFTYSVQYLIVAGGGSGGHGGGGAGGYINNSTSVTPGASFGIVVGAGGSGVAPPANGANSSAFSSTAIGGGAGGYGRFNSGSGGGSGGGASFDISSTTSGGGSGTSGQGNRGGHGAGGVADAAASGGGGAGAVGTNGFNNGSGLTSGSQGGGGGNGGAGINLSSTFGTSYGEAGWFAGGGGGGSNVNGASVGVLPQGGQGGGGDGSTTPGGATQGGQNATANTGGGGGGSDPEYPSGSAWGAGGSGIVLVRYQGSQRGSGGTVSSVVIGGATYTIHAFTSSGTFTA